jgi:hypothetical protein
LQCRALETRCRGRSLYSQFNRQIAVAIPKHHEAVGIEVVHPAPELGILQDTPSRITHLRRALVRCARFAAASFFADRHI